MMDGIIMAAHTEHPADYWTSIHRPIVAFDRTLGEGVPVVRSDHEQGGRLIARQLIDSGARHVVLVGGPRSQFAAATTFPTIRYHLTVERLLAEAGIACDYVEAGTVADLAAALAACMDSQIAADGGPASPAKNDSASDVDTQPTPEEVIPVALIPGETTR